ncbi:venom protease-like [Eupeodes corollae]|uniref:venom protease-like n=1 Tax=Eupeodes corollae TaxID=290404 RepID=UPI0024915813|nr:venom protease-like [Eupeodes corollae]
MQSWRSLLIFCLFFLNINKFILSASIGDTCVDGTNNLRGTCQPIFTCPHVLRYKISGRNYSKCGFNNNKQEIVCCAEKKIITSDNTVPTNLVLKKYAKKCEQYKAELFDTEVYSTKISAEGQPNKIIISKCRETVFPLVVGGEDAHPKEFPHMALLGCKDEKGKYSWVCGASLISTNYLLTAAHCLETTKCEKLDIVRLGDLNVEIETDDAKPKDFNIAQLLPHPEYNTSIRYNDIALIELKSEVQFNEYIRPACLPYQDFNNQSQLIVTGWGSTKLAGRNAAHLQKAGVELFEEDECNEIYSEEGENTLPAGVKYRTQICAGSKQDIKDTCQGDSGGPLQSVHPNHPCMYSIIGVTSYGQACGNIGYPGVYTRVFNYIDWIESVVWDK